MGICSVLRAFCSEYDNEDISLFKTFISLQQLRARKGALMATIA